MRRRQQTWCALVAAAAVTWLCCQAGACGDKPKKPARFAEDNPKQVDTHKAEVKFEVDKELLADKDVWVAVIAVQAPSSLWLQQTPVIASPDERVVYLGLEGALSKAEKFKVVLLSCPKGTFKKEGEVRVVDATELKVEIIDQITILRSK